MHETAILLWVTIAVAVLFDFTNGFHDTANAIATSISTRAVSPHVAVGLSALFNLVGAVVTVAFFQAKVSNTIASTLAIKPGLVVVMAALIGAISWNLITWYRGLPSSSTHALIGGLCGAGIAAAGGLGGVKWAALGKQIASLVISPPLGFIASAVFAILLILVVHRLQLRPTPVNRTFRRLQVLTAAFLSYSHGANDAQKTMAAITLALIASGNLTKFQVPLWVVFLSAATIAFGTYAGDWPGRSAHGSDRHPGRDPDRSAREHDPCDHRVGDGSRREPEALSRALGTRCKHRRRLARDDPGSGGHFMGRVRHPRHGRRARLAETDSANKTTVESVVYKGCRQRVQRR